ncbi:MAG: hypothetical protein ACK559_26785, partial [bacterium]
MFGRQDRPGRGPDGERERAPPGRRSKPQALPVRKGGRHQGPPVELLERLALLQILHATSATGLEAERRSDDPD